MAKINIIGSGGWGTANAILLAKSGHDVLLWSYLEKESEDLKNNRENKPFLPGIAIPENVSFTSDISKCGEADLIVIASPSHAVRNTAKSLAPFVKKGQLILNISKGFDEEEHQRLSQVILSEIPDAVVASMLVCELAAYWKRQGKTVLEAMKALYSQYGYYVSKVQSVELTGADAMEKAANMMADLRSNIPSTIGGAEVTLMRDYKSSIEKDMIHNTESKILLPSSNVLEFVLGKQGSVIARPSGTEPKVKFYYTAVSASEEAARSLLEKLVKQISG